VNEFTSKLMIPKIAVLGVGGAGINIVNSMIQDGLKGLDFIVANTDAQSLARSEASKKIQLGSEKTQGFGSGGNPEIGEAAAEESLDEISSALKEYQMIFITGGMGGGTGTGAVPVIAQKAKAEGIVTVAIVTLPFDFEADKKMKLAQSGLDKLKSSVDAYAIISNQKFFKIFDINMPLVEAFRFADSNISTGIQGITDIINISGQINLDFADVRSILKDAGQVMINSAVAEGENRAIEAAEKVLTNDLFDNGQAMGAKEVLVQISGGLDVSLQEVQNIMNAIRTKLPGLDNLVFGTNFTEEYNGKVVLSLIASGVKASTGYVPTYTPMSNPSPIKFSVRETVTETVKVMPEPEMSQPVEEYVEETETFEPESFEPETMAQQFAPSMEDDEEDIMAVKEVMKEVMDEVKQEKDEVQTQEVSLDDILGQNFDRTEFKSAPMEEEKPVVEEVQKAIHEAVEEIIDEDDEFVSEFDQPQQSVEQEFEEKDEEEKSFDRLKNFFKFGGRDTIEDDNMQEEVHTFSPHSMTMLSEETIVEEDIIDEPIAVNETASPKLTKMQQTSMMDFFGGSKEPSQMDNDIPSFLKE